jgi:hypothetical protein
MSSRKLAELLLNIHECDDEIITIHRTLADLYEMLRDNEVGDDSCVDSCKTIKKAIKQLENKLEKISNN